MPMGYQPPKFQSFDGKENLKQHLLILSKPITMQIQRVTSWTNNLLNPSKGMLLISTQTLHLSALTVGIKWSTNSLTTFKVPDEFMSMIELTNTKQWKDELVVDYINCWYFLSHNCNDRLCEVSIVEMCIQGGATKNQSTSNTSPKQHHLISKIPRNMLIDTHYI